MNHSNPDEKPEPESARKKILEAGAALSPDVAESEAGKVSPPKPLTPEEQMALYEKDLKENDWGHQPC